MAICNPHPYFRDLAIVSVWNFTAWLGIKLGFVLGLYLYHFSVHALYRQQMRGVFRYSSQQLRIWNEVATVFLVAIVMLVW
jgi:putative membrane protein